MARKTLSLRESRARKAQKRRSEVKTLPSPVGGWNARDALSAMPETDAVALVNFFPETTDVVLRHGSELWGNLSGGIGAGNALLIDGISGYATTPDAAAIDVAGDIDLRAYANLDDWTTSTAQFLIAKGVPGTDASYQFFVLDGKLGALIYTAVGVIAGAYLSDTVVPAVNGSPLWVRVTVDLDNGAGFSVATFYTSDDGLVWSQLGGTWPQAVVAAIANSAQPLTLGSGDYPASATYYPPLLICDAADFDGINDYMTRGAGLTGAADSKKGIFSCWLRLDGGDGNIQRIFQGVTILGGSTTRVSILRGGGNNFVVTLTSSGGSSVLLVTSSTSVFIASATWYHLLVSWDAATGTEHMYVNDVSNIGVPVRTNAEVDNTLADWGVGARPDAGNKVDGCLAEIYFAPGQYLDFSVTANRRKFISSTGKPVFLATDGSLPTGTAPIVYQHLDNGEAVANFAINRGTGGNFTITGALTAATTSPSD